MDKELEKKMQEMQKKIADLERKKKDAEKEEADLESKLKDPDAPEIVDTEPLAIEPEVKKTRKPRGKKADTNSWEQTTSKPSSKKKSTNYDKIVGEWIDQETKDQKDGNVSPHFSPEEPEQGLEPEPETETPDEPEPVPVTPVEPPPIPKSITEKVADKLASYDTKNMSKEEIAFYKANGKEVEKLLTVEKMREGALVKKERERLEKEKMERDLLNALQKAKAFGVSAINKTKTALEMFGRGGGAVTGMSKEMEPEGIYPEISEVMPEPATPKTPEQTETEFEIARRMYLEYKTGSAKYKKESELFKQHAKEKEEAYNQAKLAIIEQMVNEGKTDEAKEFITKELDLRREHEIKHGSLWNKLKGGASQKIEAWDKWGVDKEGDTWDQKLGNWNKRIIKRAINISFIGLTSSAAVAGLAGQGIGSATALAGGTFSRLGAKLGWGVTLGTVMEYAMTKIPEGVNAEKSKKVLKLVLVGGGVVLGTVFFLSGGGLSMAAATGASAAAGYGLSKYVEKKGWTEKGIQQSKENAKSKFNVSNLDKLKSYEEEYLNTLKQAENSRIYRKLTGTLLAVAGSTTSLELMGYTKDNSEEMKQVFGNEFKSFWSGVKNWWAKPWFDRDGDSKAIEIDQDDKVSEPKATPIPKEKIQAPSDNQTEAPKKPEVIADSEQKENEKNDQGDKRSRGRDNDNEEETPKRRVGKKDYSGVHKTWMNNTGGNNSHEGHNVGSNHGKPVGYTEVSGYKNYGTPYSVDKAPENSSHQVAHAPESISAEEMAYKVSSRNLNLILNTPESAEDWNTKYIGENANEFLAEDRGGLESVQIKNLQDYVRKVIDETNLKPKENESVGKFISRAFEKASSRPKMLEKLQL